MTRILVVQHEADCPPAWLGDWLLAAGCTLDVRHPYAGDALPADLDDHDALVVLGGSVGANDDHVPWIPPTKALVREAADRGVATLGVCLGHQICAVALGGAVGRNPRGKQLGLVPTGWLTEAAADPLVGGLTDVRRALHWNHDVVLRLPDDATLLAETMHAEPQVVRFAPSVWGLQMHPEADDHVIAPWAEQEQAAGRDELDAVLASVADVRDELEHEWRPLADAFVRVARTDPSERSPR